jgi:hypothetical protein
MGQILEYQTANERARTSILASLVQVHTNGGHWANSFGHRMGRWAAAILLANCASSVWNKRGWIGSPSVVIL